MLKLFSKACIFFIYFKWAYLFRTANAFPHHSPQIGTNFIRSTSRAKLKGGEIDEIFVVTQEQLNIEVLTIKANPPKFDAKESGPFYKRFWNGISKIFSTDATKKAMPPILFIHGSYHSAWCWAENFFGFFSDLGYRCYSISLRGTAATGMPPNDPGEVVRIEQHIADIRDVLSFIAEQNPTFPKPIIISHSFGGLITMKLLEIGEVRSALSAAVFLCSLPPTGNAPMTQRFITSRFCSALKIAYGFSFKALATNEKLCRELFFDDSVPSDSIQRYMRKFQSDSRVGLDIFALQPVLPSKVSAGPGGKAVWLIKSKQQEDSTGKDNSDINDANVQQFTNDRRTNLRQLEKSVNTSIQLAPSASAIEEGSTAMTQAAVGDIETFDAAQVLSETIIDVLLNTTGNVEIGESSIVRDSLLETKGTTVSATTVLPVKFPQGELLSEANIGALLTSFPEFADPKNRVDSSAAIPSVAVLNITVGNTRSNSASFEKTDAISDAAKDSESFFSKIVRLGKFLMQGIAGWLSFEGNSESRAASRKPATADSSADTAPKSQKTSSVEVSSTLALTSTTAAPTTVAAAAVAAAAAAISLPDVVAKRSSIQDLDPSSAIVNSVLPRLVIGAEKDYIIDVAGVLETGQYLGVDPVFIPGLYHDVMLGPKWNLTAAVIGQWLESVL